MKGFFETLKGSVGNIYQGGTVMAFLIPVIYLEFKFLITNILSATTVADIGFLSMLPVLICQSLKKLIKHTLATVFFCLRIH